MRLIKRTFTLFIFNLLALFAADYFISKFTIEPGIKNFAVTAIFLTLINMFLKPILKFILTPVIILTLGLFTIVLNAAILYVLDIFLEGLTIEGITSLLYATVLISVINFVLHIFDKGLKKRAL